MAATIHRVGGLVGGTKSHEGAGNVRNRVLELQDPGALGVFGVLEVEDGGVLAAMVDIALLSDVEDEGRTAVRLDYDSLMPHKYLLDVGMYRKVANGECR